MISYIVLHMVYHYSIRNGLAEAKNHRMRCSIVKDIRQIHFEYEALLDLSMQARHIRGHAMTLSDLNQADRLYKDLVAFLSPD